MNHITLVLVTATAFMFNFASPCRGESAYQKGLADLNAAIQGSTAFLPQKGTMGVFDATQCNYLNCMKINPATPYLTVGLLPSPTQTNRTSGWAEYFGGPAWGVSAPYVPGYYIDGANDLLVVVGMTPPPANYFGMTGYVASHVVNKIRIPTLASLGDTLNQYVVKTGSNSADTAPAPFNRPFVMVMGANQNLVKQFQSTFQKQLSAVGPINVLPIPAGDPELGLLPSVTNPKADEYNFEIRISYPQNQADYERYLSTINSQIQVYRLTSTKPVGPVYYGAQTPRPKGTTLSEVPYTNQLKAQVSSLLSSLGTKAKTYYQCQATQTVVDPKPCISEGKICFLDNSDAVYTVLFKGPGFFESRNGDPYEYHVFGVRSDKTINTTYDSISLETAYLSYPAGMAIGGASTKDFDGSTSDPNIFHFKFSRDCAGKKYCVAAPYPVGSSPGIDEGSGSILTGRTYLQKNTFTAPDPATMVPWVTVTNNPYACPERRITLGGR